MKAMVWSVSPVSKFREDMTKASTERVKGGE